jgi:monoamine oxidase
MDKESTDVIIIGGGVSGLSVALKLRSVGIRSIILEARDRIGGRILTFSCDSVPVDIGASFIHGGSDENPLVKVAKKYNLKFSYSKRGKQPYYYGANGEVETEEVRRKVRIYINEAMDFINSMAKDLCQNPEKPDISYQNALDLFMLQHPLPWNRNSPEFNCFERIIWEYEEWDGTDWSNLSLRGHKEAAFEGGNVCLAGGYAVLPKVLAEGADIRFNEIVKQVIYQEGNVVVQTEKNVFRGKFAVITQSVGVLQSKLIEFQPPLPETHRRSIESLRMSLMNKVVLRFKEPFWPEDSRKIYYSSTIRGEFPWFDVVEAGKPILLCWLACSYAIIMEKETDEEIISRVLKILKMIFGEKVTALVEYKVSKWNRDPFACGSYTYVPAGTKSEEMVNNLRQPVQNTLYFCGEGTTEEYMGTVHGAYITGEETATKIINYLQTY